MSADLPLPVSIALMLMFVDGRVILRIEEEFIATSQVPMRQTVGRYTGVDSSEKSKEDRRFYKKVVLASFVNLGVLAFVHAADGVRR